MKPRSTLASARLLVAAAVGDFVYFHSVTDGAMGKLPLP